MVSDMLSITPIVLVDNGIKQGGVSAYLFRVYLDGLTNDDIASLFKGHYV